MLSSLNDILPDMPFLLIATLTVFLIGHIFVERRPFLSSAADRALLGLLFTLAFLIRHGGVVLVLTAAGAQILSRGPVASVGDGKSSSLWSRFNLIQLSPYLCFAVLTALAYELLPSGILAGVTPLEESSRGYIFPLGAFFDGLPHPYVVVAATFPLLAMGIVRGARVDYHILLYAFLMILFYFFSPDEGLRYWLPLLPFYVHFLLVGLRWTSEALEIRWTAAVKYVTAVLLVLVAVYFFGSSRDRALGNIYAQRKVSSGPFAETSQDIFSFIREKTPPDSVIVFFNPRVMRLFTDRRSIRLERASDLPRGNYLCIYAQKKDGDGQLVENIVDGLVKTGKLRLLYANSDFRLYEMPA